MSCEAMADVIMKFGGSAVTDKGNFETFREAGAAAAAQLVKKMVEAGLKVVLVHGAGSFGHPQAKKFGVKKGWVDAGDADQVKRGFSLTRTSCLKLHTKILQQLMDAGVPAVGVSPCSGWVTHGGNVVEAGVRQVTNLLQDGFVPLLHGDCVRDQLTGCTILSGDTVIKVLCKELGVKRVVFLTDVLGIYDQPPHLPGAKFMSQIIVSKDGKMKQRIETELQSCDVTGGVNLKLDTARDIVTESGGAIPVFVCLVGSHTAEVICLQGRQPEGPSDGGTVIMLDQEK